MWVPLWKLRRGQLVSPNVLQAGRCVFRSRGMSVGSVLHVIVPDGAPSSTPRSMGSVLTAIFPDDVLAEV
mgnify:CR=1 FL=1